MMRSILWCLPVFLMACAPDDPRPAAQQATSSAGDDDAGVASECVPGEGESLDHGCAPRSACVDGDHDGFGQGCALGADCDDQDPTVRDECVRCAAPSEGCACHSNDAPVACDVDTDGPVTPITCWIGQRTCVRGEWNRCTAYNPRFH